MTKCPYGKSYRNGCRCDACRAKVTGYIRDYRRRNAEKVWGKTFDSDLVSPEPATKVIWDAYSTKGMTFAEIARITNVQRETVQDIYYQRRKMITRGVERKILAALDVDWVRRNYDENTKVDAHKYTWIVHALHAQGWREPDMDKLLFEHGIHDNPNGLLRHAKRGNQMYWSTARKILWLKKHIGDKPGPSNQTRQRAQKAGYFPLIHYTEDGELIVDSLLPEQRELWRKLR